MKDQEKKQARILYRERFSRSGLLQAYEQKVSLSHAVGRDGIRQSDFRAMLDREIEIIQRNVAQLRYKFTSYKARLVSKGAAKPPRPLSIPTIRDRLTLRVLNSIISDVFPESRISKPHSYIKRIKECISSEASDVVFLRIDIENYYPSILHDILIRKIKRKIRIIQLIDLIRKSISTQTFGVPLENNKGVPQGLSISNILSSIYLENVDNKYGKKCTYFRYVDDILVICKNNEAEDILKEIQKDTKSLGLSCHELGKKGKTHISPIDEGIEYLGFHITRALVSVRPSSFTRMMENILSVFTQHKRSHDKSFTESKLIWRLNIKITGCIFNGDKFGWVFFFSQIDDLRQLARLDGFVTRELNRRGLSHLRSRIKKFLRAHHEIRFNLENTRYIRKYDDFGLDEMISELSQAEGLPEEEYRTRYSEREIRAKFRATISRQTRQLERDLIQSIS